jgi:type III pantothenate kinase
MKLLIDLGNSRLKWCWSDAGTASAGKATPHAGVAPEVVVARLEAPPGRIAEIRVASVAGPAVTAALVAALQARFASTVRSARSAASVPGLRSAYHDPAQLGIDRWLALRAVAHDGAGAACVVSVGTACTLDLLAPGGEHRGGLIVPGLGLMATALRSATGDLGRLADSDPPAAAAVVGTPLVARATGAAMKAGAQWALVALVHHHFAAWQVEFPTARLVVTGGDAPALLPLLPGAAEHRPDLVLQGLACEPFTAAPAG